MNILEKIIAHKKQEVDERKSLYPVKLLEKSLYFDSACVSLKKYLLRPDKSGIIAEIKRKSPSKGSINPYISVEQISIGYMQAGASALSILTDTEFFGGKNDDLTIARKFNFCPVLRKDFIIDEYQVLEAKSIGADVLLLIADAIEPAKIKDLAVLAKSLGMEVLLEVRNEAELQRSVTETLDLIGVNNRNLRDFKVDITQSEKLVDLIPNDFLKISESGISHPQTIHHLKKIGFHGFLMGEHFMHSSQPDIACSNFIKELNSIPEFQIA